MKQIRDCAYSAFVSYANEDDDSWSGWVSDFKRQLAQVVPSRARVAGVPPVFFGKDTPAVAGRLSDTLKKAVASSFAMVIVVHESYAKSDWCLKELEYFRELFGEDGFLDRLYVVAMSKDAIESVEKKDAWKRLCPNRDQVWLPFFQADNPNDPMPMRLDTDEGKSVPSTEFLQRFNRLASDLALKITRSAELASANPRSDPFATRAAPVWPAGDRATLPPQMASAATASVLLGVTTPELADAVASFRTALLSLGVRAESLGRDALFGDFPDFDAAQRLVLPFNNAQPMLSAVPGGHLALQRDAWRQRGKPADSLLWLDLCHVPAAQPARAEQAAFVAALVPQALQRDALLTRLGGKAPAPDAAAGGDSDAVRIYIESNQNERLLWKPLGEQIRKKWDRLTAGKQIAPPLVVVPRGLPIDEFESSMTLDDADGVVLFWGKKESSSLVPQINKVEARWRGSDLPPCIVAYLTPPQPWRDDPMPSYVWQVLRFEAAVEEDIDVVPGDTQELDRFLLDILTRTTRKRMTARARALPTA